jgi:hypothetical protein
MEREIRAFLAEDDRTGPGRIWVAISRGMKLIQEGIYLEEKKGTVGTSGTSKPIVYRNLWATREIGPESVVLQLLDDKANPTGLTEEVSPAELERRFVHRPVKPEVWAALKTRLQSGSSPQPKPKPKPQPKSPKKAHNAAGASKSWWET